MKRYFYISDDLDDLEILEKELSAQGLSSPQIHVLSGNSAEVERHHLNEVHDFMKKDVVHSTLRAALLGLGVAVLTVLLAYISGLPEVVGWIPFAFLSVVMLGFCTWEGGMWGIQHPNSRFRQFQEALQQGRHVLVIDGEPGQDQTIKLLTQAHPKLQFAGTGSAAPRWIVRSQKHWKEFLRWAP